MTRELVLDRLDGRTAEQALAAGVPTSTVWLELCIANDVPVERRHGRGLPSPSSPSSPSSRSSR